MKKFLLLFLLSIFVNATELHYTKDQLKQKWLTRINSFIDQGKLPLIDMEASLTQKQMEEYFPQDLKTLDKYAIALTCFDGYQRPKDGSKGYRWSDYILDLVNKYPEYFVPTANGGTNPNWVKQKGGKSKHFIDQMEKEIKTGKYFNMGELEFRHYMSSSQCKNSRYDRDVIVPLTSENGHRLFQLASDTGVPFVIHLEPEDQQLKDLETMLQLYPKAKVICAHFGQIRHPKVQTKFTPTLIRHLLSTYPNLYYDLATGSPNRKYKCSGSYNNKTLSKDTILWKENFGYQTEHLKEEYQKILTDFSTRFVFATDYGGGRPPLDENTKIKTENFYNIIKDLPLTAQQNIAYKNAWFLLTGEHFPSKGKQ